MNSQYLPARWPKFCGVFWLLLLTPVLSFAQNALFNTLDDYLRTQTQGLLRQG